MSKTPLIWLLFQIYCFTTAPTSDVEQKLNVCITNNIGFFVPGGERI